MSQQAWNITGVKGTTYKLGLFHGDDTGHVVLHCNDKVVAIDFDVKEEKTYSLFLDEELCEVKIAPENGHFAYDCRINLDAQTPLNEKRKQLRADQSRVENLRLLAATVVGVLVVIFLIAAS